MVHDFNKIPVLSAHTDFKDKSLAQNIQNISIIFANIHTDYQRVTNLSF
jgi:hypothetical protein